MFGMPKLPYGMFGVAGGSDTRPTNTPEDMSALQKMFAATQAANRTPQGRINRGFAQFGPAGQMPQPTAPMLPTPPTPAPVDMGSPAPAPQATTPPALSAQALAPPAAPQGVTMPMPRPAEAPQAPPDMGFFQRNSAMMQDPTNGGFIDPEGAARAQASGPDVINKLMSYFHKKDDPSNG